MNAKSIIGIFLFLFIATLQAQQPKLTIDLNKKGINISPTLYGAFFEDINHAADGGLYAELIRNRSFEDAKTVDTWAALSGTATTVLSIDTTNQLNPVQKNSLKMVVSNTSPTVRGGVSNAGYWGINIVKDREYVLTFFAKCDNSTSGDITVSLENIVGTKYAQAVVSGLSTGWQKFTCKLTATGSNTLGRFVISTNTNGTYWFDVVSLFPPTFKDRPNGLRPELAQLVVDMKPKFMRFPGGCFVEGDTLKNRFQWKKTIGNIEDRPGHVNLWGYRTTDGMGFHEFLQFSEDLGAEPLYVVNIGNSHTDYQPYNNLGEYIQDALDALEYANGDVTTTYGAMRSANGHPNPFNIKYLEIGNENNQPDGYGSNNYYLRYKQFYDAIKAKYPDMQCIGDVQAWGNDNPTWNGTYTTQFVDQHFYRTYDWFVNNFNKYDNVSRTGAKIYVGEYATTTGAGYGNYGAAMGEAVYMLGMEKNSDVVKMCSYAPMFVNVNNRKWSPDLINYNASSVYCTPSYYVQTLFASNIGDVLIPVSDSAVVEQKAVSGSIGLGSWATAVQYKEVSVTKKDGTVLFSDTFDNSTNWTAGTGLWAVANNIYSQTSTSNDCRSIGKSVSDSTYTYTVKAMKTSGSEGFLIIFGYKDSKNFYWWNLGGWSNAKHGIEQSVNGSKTTLTTTNGSINTNQWYTIRIEVSAGKILCYLDNVLIHTLLTDKKVIYSNSTYDSASKQLYVKVVNTSNAPKTTRIDLQNLDVNTIPCTVSELSSTYLTDENSLSTPTKIVPAVTLLNLASGTINHQLKPYSVNVFKFDVSGVSGIEQPKTSSDSFVTIYPTFTNDFINIKSTIDESFDVEVFDISGYSTINTKAIGSAQINVTGLSRGVYFMKIKKNGRCFVQKVVKI